MLVLTKAPLPRNTATTPSAVAKAAKAGLILANQLCFALYSASLTMTKAYQPMLKKIGLTYPQYLVMLVLWEQDKRSVSTLGDRLYLDSGTLTPLLKRLEALILIVRTRDAVDERRVIVSLTGSGRRLQRRALAISKQIACATECSRSEREALTNQLVKLRAALIRSTGGSASNA